MLNANALWFSQSVVSTVMHSYLQSKQKKRFYFILCCIRKTHSLLLSLFYMSKHSADWHGILIHFTNTACFGSGCLRQSLPGLKGLKVNGVETFSGLKREFNSLQKHGVFGSGCLRQSLPGLKGLKVSHSFIYRQFLFSSQCVCVSIVRLSS